MKILILLVGVAVVSTLVLPRRSAPSILQAQSRSFANMIRAAQGGPEKTRPEPPKSRQGEDVPTIWTHEFVDGEWKRAGR